MISARVSLATRARFQALAEHMGVPVGGLLRLLATAAVSADAKTLADIAAMLDLDEQNASPDAVKAALDELIRRVATPADESATSETADPPPPAALSTSARALAAGLDPAHRARFSEALAMRNEHGGRMHVEPGRKERQ